MKKSKTLEQQAERWARLFGHSEVWRENSNCWTLDDKGQAAITGWLAGYRAAKREKRKP